VGYVIIFISLTLSKFHVLEEAFETGSLVVGSAARLAVVLDAVDTSWLVVLELGEAGHPFASASWPATAFSFAALADAALCLLPSAPSVTGSRQAGIPFPSSSPQFFVAGVAVFQARPGGIAASDAGHLTPLHRVV
jgi:hypothetical protein